MPKRGLLPLIFILSGLVSESFSQKREREFSIPIPNRHVEHSLYNKVSCLDSREDTATIGLVKDGYLDRSARLVAKVPLGKQLELAFDSLIGNDAGQGQLLLQFRRLLCGEYVEDLVETGDCYFRACLYTKVKNRYRLLNRIDTLVRVTSDLDVTTKLIKAAGNAITGFVAENLLNQPADTVSYSYAEVKNIDSIEKSKIPLYTANVYKDGVYSNYKSFFNQKPDWENVKARISGDRLFRVRYVNNKGNTDKAYCDIEYAVVYKGIPYMASHKGYYALVKSNNNFYFNGQVSPGANGGPIYSYGRLFGATVYILRPGATVFYEIRIDHVTGKFVLMKQLDDY